MTDPDPTAETATRALHRITSYDTFDEERVWEPPVDDPRVRTDFTPNDVGRLPWFYKRYDDDLPRVELPRQLPATTASAVDVLAGAADVPPGELDLPALGRLLHLSAGVVRTAQRPRGTFLYRAAGSAGGRFPLELYVAVPDGHPLPAGVHWYHPEEHALVRIGPAPAGEAPAVVATGVPWRTGWRYRERGYRHVYWDAGTMLSQLLAAAGSAGLPARLHTGFPDRAVAEMVGADRVHEWPVAVVALGAGAPALSAVTPAATGMVDAAPLELPLVTAAQRAGEQDRLGAPVPAGAPVEAPAAEPRPVEVVVLARGSKRLMDPAATLPAQVLRTALEVAMRGVDVPHWVVVHAVDGMAPGLYRWPDLSTPLRAGDLRDEAYHFCMDQGLGRDAAFVVVSAVDLDRLDDHGYREAQLTAGLVEGRLHLLAYALGASASGMTFVDGLVAPLLGVRLAGLLVTCVGVGEYASPAGGGPGRPTPVRQVTPRL